MKRIKNEREKCISFIENGIRSKCEFGGRSHTRSCGIRRRIERIEGMRVLKWGNVEVNEMVNARKRKTDPHG